MSSPVVHGQIPRLEPASFEVTSHTLPPTFDDDWEPPREFDDYRLVRRLGQGAMGDVHLAHDRVLDRAVAIKFIHIREAFARERFLVEARAAARIQHPNVMAIHRVGTLAERPYLVSEYVRGEGLDALPVPLPWPRALELGIGLARGLAAAHRQGVLHRDIKLANAILGEDGTVKLLDFSLAKLVDDPSGDASGVRAAPGELDVAVGQDTMNGTLVGTPNYMAPELWRADPSTRASDVYALGVVLHMLIAGRPPYEANTAAHLAELVQDHEPAPLESIVAGVDPRFAAIVDRCLRSRAGDRFASGEELRSALESVATASRGSRARAGNPYRGLRAFEAEHRDLFFGRTGEIASVVDRLRALPFVLVAGDSGVGKSSLCRAGVLPAVVDGGLGGGVWRTAAVMPGRAPLRTFVTALADGLGLDTDAVMRAAEDPTDLLEREVRRALGGGGLVLCVDQLEELVTLAPAAEAAAAAQLLTRIALASVAVRVLATARGDFLTRIASLPGVQAELPRGLFFLLPMTAEGVRTAIVGPAQAQGVRFESPELVERLVTAGVEGSLPLLQFALAELWEARDHTTATITAASLGRIGGVAGALARHADSVLARLDPAQRRAARALLIRLVTVDDTRASLTAEELLVGPESRAALDALIAARLIVVRDVPQGSVHEIAHEALIRGWLTLQVWLDEDREARLVRHRIDVAAAEWDRLGKPVDVLWSERQLAEARLVDAGILHARERTFLGASQARAARRRRARRLAIAAAPVLLIAAVIAVYAAQLADVARRVDAHVAAAELAVASARAGLADMASRRTAAFAAYDAGDREAGEAAWKAALAGEPAVLAAHDDAARELETALSIDGARLDVRGRFADVLIDRAALAEQMHRPREAAALLDRARLYDFDGARVAAWALPARVDFTTDPPGARVLIQTYADDEARRTLSPPRDLGVTPLQGAEVPAGSHLLTFIAEGRPELRLPLSLARGEVYTQALGLPARVPDGFVAIPAGRFLFGSAADEDLRTGFLMAAPQHAVRTDGFLIARHETTWAEWIAFLDALPPERQAAHLHTSAGGLQQAPTLARGPGGAWELRFPRGDRVATARSGEPLVYATRTQRAAQDWSRMPVSGIDWADAAAYLQWLGASGRVPGARFCSELEWERAARGADGRIFPHGDRLAPEDANYDETYGREFAAMGPDAVGSYPLSRSPYGVDDLVGNVFEWTTSAFTGGERVTRGGGYFFGSLTNVATNRAVFGAEFRDGAIGLRVCAPLPP